MYKNETSINIKMNISEIKENSSSIANQKNLMKLSKDETSMVMQVQDIVESLKKPTNNVFSKDEGVMCNNLLPVFNED